MLTSSALTPRSAALIAATVPSSEVLVTLIVCVALPTVRDSSMALPSFIEVLDALNPLDMLLCSWATWLTVIELVPALAVLFAVAVKALVWLLLTEYVLKSLESFRFCAVTLNLFSTEAADAKPVIFASPSSILRWISDLAGALSASTKASTIFFVSKEAPAPRALM